MSGVALLCRRVLTGSRRRGLATTELLDVTRTGDPIRQQPDVLLNCSLSYVCDARGGRSGIEPDTHLGHGVA